MVTTSRSHRYTVPALESFFRNTVLAPDDQVLVIDNDGDFAMPSSLSRAEPIRHASPRGFAQNVNLAMKRAAEAKADLVFLNNDMIFTRHWLMPLLFGNDQILTPACNQHFQYDLRGLSLKVRMDWEDYEGHEEELEEIAQRHARAFSASNQLIRPLRISFYCFRIPRPVYETVGPFDEAFGPGGGEDVDYRLRALLAGFDVAIAAQSYVLHFMGKSTWDSGEDDAVRRAREIQYLNHFGKKWGEALALLFLYHKDVQSVAAELGVEKLLAAQDYRRIIGLCKGVSLS